MQETSVSVVLIDIENRNEHLDFSLGVTETDRMMLEEAKRQEEYHIRKGDLVRIDTKHGYIMTNNPHKYKHLKQ